MAIGVISIFMALLVAALSTPTPAPPEFVKATESKPTAVVESPVVPEVHLPIPADEQAFIEAVRQGQAAASSAPNEMAKGGTRAVRRAAICRSLSQLAVSGWVGRISLLESNGDGKGVLNISLADSITVKTWNNDFSDIEGHTLIDPTSPLCATVSQMHKGDQVTFSGTFLGSDLDCVRETSLTLDGSMSDPEFVFRFATVQHGTPSAISGQITNRPSAITTPASQPQVASSASSEIEANSFAAPPENTSPTTNSVPSSPAQSEAQSLVAQGRAQFSRGKYVDALESAEQALKLDPNNREASELKRAATPRPTAVTAQGAGAGARTAGNLEVLSDTQGVDLGPYLSRILQAVRMNWYKLIPEAARPPLFERGKVSIEFAILPDGKVAGMRIIGPSGDVALDRAAWGGITASNPFAPLPSEFHGPYLALRFHFYYNPPKGDMQ
jgi:TonB family protein